MAAGTPDGGGEQDGIHIRPLEPCEWKALPDFRLAALGSAPGFFLGSLDEEVNWSPEDWQRTIKGPAHQVFGLFDQEILIGITAAFTWRGDTRGRTAVLAMSFVLPHYRGRGLSRLFYEARLAWIRDQPQFRRIVVSHRASNEASRHAIQKRGFVHTNIVAHLWPDGQTEDEVFYEMNLSDRT